MCGEGAYLWTTAQAQEGYSTSGCRTYTLTRRRVEKFTRQAESCFWSGNIELTPGRPSESWWTALRIAASRHLLHSPSHKNTFSLQRYCTVLKIVRWCEQMLQYTCLTIPLRCGEHCCSPISFSYYVQLLLGNKSKPLSTFCAFPNMKKTHWFGGLYLFCCWRWFTVIAEIVSGKEIVVKWRLILPVFSCLWRCFAIIVPKWPVRGVSEMEQAGEKVVDVSAGQGDRRRG